MIAVYHVSSLNPKLRFILDQDTRSLYHYTFISSCLPSCPFLSLCFTNPFFIQFSALKFVSGKCTLHAMFLFPGGCNNARIFSFCPAGHHCSSLSKCKSLDSITGILYKMNKSIMYKNKLFFRFDRMLFNFGGKGNLLPLSDLLQN